MPQLETEIVRDLNTLFHKHLAAVIVGTVCCIGIVVGTAVGFYWLSWVEIASQANATEIRAITTEGSLQGHLTQRIDDDRELRGVLGELSEKISEIQADVAVIRDRTEQK